MVHSPAEATGLGSMNKADTVSRREGTGTQGPNITFSNPSQSQGLAYRLSSESSSCKLTAKGDGTGSRNQGLLRVSAHLLGEARCDLPRFYQHSLSWGQLLRSEAQARFQGRKPSHYRWRMRSQDPKHRAGDTFSPESSTLQGSLGHKFTTNRGKKQQHSNKVQSMWGTGPPNVALGREIQSGRLYPARVKCKGIHSGPFVYKAVSSHVYTRIWHPHLTRASNNWKESLPQNMFLRAARIIETEC